MSDTAGARRVVVGLTGASGAIYGVRSLQVLGELGVETHLVTTRAGMEVATYETGLADDALEALACRSYRADDLWAPVASGSFRCAGLLVAPCSMHTLGAVAAGLGENLLQRAVAVSLKEGWRTVLVPREAPLSVIHIENMLKVARAGARVVPASPGFYHDPRSIGDLVDFVVGKALDALGIDNDLFRRWEGRP